MVAWESGNLSLPKGGQVVVGGNSAGNGCTI